MKFSGQLSLVDDFDLRNEIVDYYEGFSELELIEETRTFWITRNLTPFYIENFDMMSFQFINAETVDQITFKNRMFGYRVLLQQNLNTYLDLQESNKALFEVVEKYLE